MSESGQKSNMEQKAQEEEFLASATTGQEALDHAISAVELYMKACSEVVQISEKSRLRQKFNELADTAQKMKAAMRGPVQAATSSSLSPLSSDSSALIAQGSILSGSVFPPWRGDPSPGRFDLSPGDDKYTDPTNFDLSDDQVQTFKGWKRPLELFGAAGEVDDAALMECEGECDLVQDLTADCSVVASMCASMRLMVNSGPASLLSSIMFPYDKKKGRPALSRNGKYMFRMYFNGCFRQVEIDDRLPSSNGSSTLYAVDRQKPTLIWPALLEKAYLKLRGGYDFPGSNSGTDLHVITGWIPEQLFLQSEDVDVYRSWDRVAAAYQSQDVIVTLGTGGIDETETRAFGLVGEHDYAVLDCRLVAGTTWQLLVKNPWCDGTVWKRPAVTAAHNAYGEFPLKAGTFWMDLEDVAQNFESMYLNWNPSLFSHRVDRHFVWAPPPRVFALSVAYNRQYAVSTQTDGPLWILLSRHFADGELEIARRKADSRKADSRGASEEEDLPPPPIPSLTAVSKRLGFMSIMVFEAGGMRVDVMQNFSYRGPFVDSPQTLARINNAAAGRVYTVVPVDQDLPLPRYGFSISFLSVSPISVRDAEPPMTEYATRLGSWTRQTAGGNSTSPQYPQNPQYSLSVPRATPLSVLLTTESARVAIRADLVWARGGRVAVLQTRDLVAYSGDYRRGCALLETAQVDAGTYTLVCSTYEAGQLGRFALRIGSRCPVVVAEVPAKAAGRLRTELPPLFFAAGEERKRTGLWACRLTRAMVTIRSCGGGSHQMTPAGAPGTATSGTTRPATALRISIMYGGGGGGSGRSSAQPITTTVVAVSNGGRFREADVAPLDTADFDIEPDRVTREGMWLAVEQAGSQHTAPGQGIAVEILSDYAVTAGRLWESC